MQAILDIETDKLHDATTIWVLVVKNIQTSEVFKFFAPPEKGALDWITEVIGHNIIDFDLPQLDRLWGLRFVDKVKVTDTLVLSRMMWQNIEGGHSLKEWGVRFRFPKIDFDQFHVLSEEMIDYCVQDVQLSHKLYLYLMKKMSKFSRAVDLEMQFAIEVQRMQSNGFPFNINRARRLKAAIEEPLAAIENEINKEVRPRVVSVGDERVPFVKKDGSIGFRTLKFSSPDIPTAFSAGAPFVPVAFKSFNPNSHAQVSEKLHEWGWKPVEKTDGHKEARTKEEKNRFEVYGWKLSETNLATVPEEAPPISKTFLRRTILETRRRKLAEWIALYRDSTGCIHGSFSTLGTWTHRMSHSAPNMANVSAKKSIKYKSPELNRLATYLGGTFRHLWTSGDPNEDMYLVGVDAEGIQLRVFGHYINNAPFIQALVSGNKKEGTDPHSVNKRLLGPVCADRDTAKTFIYAFLLGAGINKIAEILGCTTAQAKQATDAFVKGTPGVELFKQVNEREADKGFFYAIDGRPVMCDNAHKMTAGKLQSAEAIIIKTAVVETMKQVRQAGIPARLINVVHDEMIFLTKGLEAAKTVLAISTEEINKAGETYNLNCPMKGLGQIGKTWAETH